LLFTDPRVQRRAADADLVEDSLRATYLRREQIAPSGQPLTPAPDGGPAPPVPRFEPPDAEVTRALHLRMHRVALIMQQRLQPADPAEQVRYWLAVARAQAEANQLDEARRILGTLAAGPGRAEAAAALAELE